MRSKEWHQEEGRETEKVRDACNANERMRLAHSRIADSQKNEESKHAFLQPSASSTLQKSRHSFRIRLKELNWFRFQMK